ncbi:MULTISPECIES: type II toxin-antitoxin system HipA family toxin [Cellulosimicrobium]|uniref:type II toxin-antitoxin system HipA family toxin n=1 Tax=Cellulosimicrobium TaxID=157920 RepID=UPI00119E727A|nr:MULTISPECIES: HipA domain-containing protein [Cellulosimicrobium]MBE9939980.1 type II toxin-antitoxin system HipA family toxin [Cellulosimicrobium cellulans]
MTTLTAWLYGTPVATLAPTGLRTTDGTPRVTLTWTTDALDRWGHDARVLSHLLPITPPDDPPPHPARVAAWLDGLLPEGRTRDAMAIDAGIDPDDALAFLVHYGHDTAGAVLLAPEGQPLPTPGTPERLDDTAVARLLRAAVARSGGEGRTDHLTSSLPGMEPKITLLHDEHGWARPHGTAPTTHILKVARPSDSPTADLVNTEAAALDLARRIGLTTVDAHVTELDGERAIVVTRYDRVPDPADPTGTARLHQEDAAQALGINTRDPERKFQHGRRFPSLAAIARTLRDDGTRPDPLLALTTLNLALGNTDAHAKNISVLRHADGTVRLAPAYDIAMHLHHDHASRAFAMDVAGERDMDRLTADHLVTEGTTWGLPRRRAQRAVAQTLDGLLAALADIDRDAHPGVSRHAWRTVERRTTDLRRTLVV